MNPEVMALLGGGGAVAAPRVLGPTADYIGVRLLDSVKAGENLARVIMRAALRLGDERLAEPGVVSPSVAREVLDQATWTEEEIRVEYLSGVLASARTRDGADDRGITHASLIGRLPSDALRAHMVLHRAALEASGNRWNGEVIIGHPLRDMSHHIFEVAWDALVEVVGGPAEFEGSMTPWDRQLRALYVLEREQLAEGPTARALGSADFGDGRGAQRTFRYKVTPQGLELFLWGMGLGSLPTAIGLNEYFTIQWDKDLPRLPVVDGLQQE